MVMPTELTKQCPVCGTELYYAYNYKMWKHLTGTLADECHQIVRSKTVRAKYGLAFECTASCPCLGGIHRPSFLGGGEAAPGSKWLKLKSLLFLQCLPKRKR